MGRPPRQLPETEPTARPLPPVDEVMAAIAVVLAPLLRLLVAGGADYTRMSAQLKPLFIEQARLALLRAGRKDTDSAVSLLSGVHRKDVREWRSTGLAGKIAKEVSISSKVYARWVQDPLYRDRRNGPKPLPRLGPAPSFETLARSVTQDVHPYTLLTEMIRLGLVQVHEHKGREMVTPQGDGYVPSAGSRESVELFGSNLSDHAAAAVNNLLGQPAQLEQSVFAEGITAESAQRLSEMARTLWSRSRSEMIAEATRLHGADQGRDDATCRMRFGSYYWAQDALGNPPSQDATSQAEHHDPE